MRSRMAMLCVACVSVCAAHPANALAAKFGDSGTMVPSGMLSYSRTHSAPPEAKSTDLTELLLSPSLQYFIGDNLALGLGVEYGRGSTESANTVVRGGSASIAYNLLLSDTVSFFPTASMLYASTTFELDIPTPSATGGTRAVHGTTIYASIYAPILLHVGNFFAGAGPFYRTTLSNQLSIDDEKAFDAEVLSTLGIKTIIGAWF